MKKFLIFTILLGGFGGCWFRPKKPEPVRIQAISLLSTEHYCGTGGSPASITIPASTDFVVVFWGWYAGSGTMTACDIDGNSMTIVQNAPSTGSDFGRGAAYLVSPPTGSQDFSYSGSPNCAFGFAYFSGIDESTPVRDSDNDYVFSSSGTASVTINSNTDDYVIGFGTDWNTGDIDLAPSGSGQTIDLNNQNCGCTYPTYTDIGHEDSPGASTTTFTADGSYPTLVVLSLEAGAAAEPSSASRRTTKPIWWQ